MGAWVVFGRNWSSRGSRNGVEESKPVVCISDCGDKFDLHTLEIEEAWLVCVEWLADKFCWVCVSAQVIQTSASCSVWSTASCLLEDILVMWGSRANVNEDDILWDSAPFLCRLDSNCCCALWLGLGCQPQDQSGDTSLPGCYTERCGPRQWVLEGWK